MEILELKVEERQATGKENARKIRGQGLLPAVLYGQDSESIPLTVDARDFFNLTHSGAGAHVIIKLKMDGDKKAPTVIVKEIQRDPIRDKVLHIDFQKIALNEKIQASVPVNIIGDSVGIREGGILQHGTWELEVEALPTDIPGHIEVDITDIHVGESIRVRDLPAIEKVLIVAAEDDVIASIIPPPTLKEAAIAPEEEEVEPSPEVVGEEAEKAEE